MLLGNTQWLFLASAVRSVGVEFLRIRRHHPIATPGRSMALDAGVVIFASARNAGRCTPGLCKSGSGEYQSHCDRQTADQAESLEFGACVSPTGLLALCINEVPTESRMNTSDFQTPIAAAPRVPSTGDGKSPPGVVEMRLIIGGADTPPRKPDGALLKAIARAHRWFEPKPKPGRIDDGARRGLASLQCDRSSAPTRKFGASLFNER